MNNIDLCLWIITALALVSTYLLYRINVNISAIAAGAREHVD